MIVISKKIVGKNVSVYVLKLLFLLVICLLVASLCLRYVVVENACQLYDENFQLKYSN